MTSRDGQDLDWRLRLGWGIGSLGASTLINGVSFLALFFFTRVLGLEPALAGTLIFATRLFDIVTDPLMGLISDRADSRMGRRRPFLLAGAIVSAIAFAAIFNPPDRPGGVTIGWCAMALLTYAGGYTLFIVPYLAMPAEMTSGYHERSRLMSTRVAFTSLGMLVAGALGPVLVGLLGGGRQGYAGMSLILAGLIGLSMLASYFGTRRARFTQRVEAPMGLPQAIATAFQNRSFVWLLASKFMHLTGVSVTNASLLFVITVVLARPESAAGIFGVTAATGVMISMPAWLAASQRFGKRNTYLVAASLYVPVMLSWLLADPAEPVWLLALRGTAIGLLTGGLTLTAQAMLPDAIEHDARRTGLRREASLAAVYSAVEKTAAATGPLVLGLLLGGQSNLDTAADTIRYSAAVLPAIASALSAALLLGYGLDRTYRQEIA
jgi:GPH family glycoside/pentoside/hexuronide:cation symporter